VEADEVEALLQRFDSLLAEAALVLLCGSGQGPALAGVYARMIEAARQQGVRCILDSSGEALALALQARPYMVKVNVLELSSYLQRPLETRAAQMEGLLALHAAGVQIAALSRGAQGMLGADGAEIWEGQLGVNRIVNVVGCGDSLLAGVAQALTEGASLEDVVRRGVAFGAANTQVRGAGFIDMETVAGMLPKVTMTRTGLESIRWRKSSDLRIEQENEVYP
jgi:fructose-1-phosphate kinase PfkB-like protein